MPVVSRLTHRPGIIVPSRNRHGQRLPGKTRRVIREAVATWFAHAFAGSTADRTQIRPRLRGRWGATTGVAVEEVEEVWAYCTAAEFNTHRPGLVRLAEQVARDGDQDAIAILVDSGMELVVREETS